MDPLPFLRVPGGIAQRSEHVRAFDIQLSGRRDHTGSPPLFRVVAGHTRSFSLLERERLRTEHMLQQRPPPPYSNPYLDDIGHRLSFVKP